MKKQAVYLTYDGLTDPLGFSQILPYQIEIAQAFPQIEFLIISFEKTSRYRHWKEKVENLIAGKNIRWIPLRYTRIPPILSQLWNLYLLYRILRKALKTQRVVLIHTRSYMTSLVAFYLKQRFSFLWIFDMRGLWADERVEGNLWSLKNPIYRTVYRFFKKKEKAFLRQADWIITLTHRSVPILSQIAEKPIEEKLSVIPTATDYQVFQLSGEEPKTLRKNLFPSLPESATLLVFSGSLGTWYLLDEMLLFFKLLLTQQPNSYFLFLSHSDPHLILKQIKEMGISNDRVFIRSVHYTEVPRYLEASSGSICFIKPTFSKTASFPTKIGEYLAMGLPVIANAVGDVQWILAETGGGICLEDLSQESLHQALGTFLNLIQHYHNPEERKKLREKARLYLDKEIAAQTYVTIYQNLLANDQ